MFLPGYHKVDVRIVGLGRIVLRRAGEQEQWARQRTVRLDRQLARLVERERDRVVADAGLDGLKSGDEVPQEAG